MLTLNEITEELDSKLRNLDPVEEIFKWLDN